MKAIELLRVLSADLMTYDGSLSLRDWFGAVSYEGEMLLQGTALLMPVMMA